MAVVPTIVMLYMSLFQDNPALEKLIKHFTTKTTKEKFEKHMSDINGGFNKTAKESQERCNGDQLTEEQCMCFLRLPNKEIF